MDELEITDETLARTMAAVLGRRGGRKIVELRGKGYMKSLSIKGVEARKMKRAQYFGTNSES